MSSIEALEDRQGEKGDENKKKDENKARNLIENQISQTALRPGAMPSEKDVEEWGMKKDRYVEVCRAMVVSSTMCYQGREGDDLSDEDFFCELAGDGSIIPFTGVMFKRPADASADGRGAEMEEQRSEELDKSEAASQESSKSEISQTKKEGRGKNPQQYLSFPAGDIRKPLSQAAAEMLTVDRRAEACYRYITANNLPQKYTSKPPKMWLRWYKISEEEYAEGLSQALGLEQPASEKGEQQRMQSRQEHYQKLQVPIWHAKTKN